MTKQKQVAQIRATFDPKSKIDQDEILRMYWLAPIDHPLGDGHHTDVPFSKEDAELGGALAWFLGGLFVDKNIPREAAYCDTYFYREMTAEDVWRRVVRALRIHGLKIEQRDEA